MDRWYFCSNSWWLSGEEIKTKGSAVVMSNLNFLNWTVQLQPSKRSLLYNFHTEATTSHDGIAFFDGRTSSKGWSNTVKIFPDEQSGHFHHPCFGELLNDTLGSKCWDGSGEILARRSSVCNQSNCNTFELFGARDPSSFSNIEFPFGP